MVERKYARTRLESGDYLIPSNDRQKLWRIYRYTEDGSVDGLEGEFWAASRFNGSIEKAQLLMNHDPEEFLSWSSWEFWSGPHRTRKAAENDVIR